MTHTPDFEVTENNRGQLVVTFDKDDFGTVPTFYFNRGCVASYAWAEYGRLYFEDEGEVEGLHLMYGQKPVSWRELEDKALEEADDKRYRMGAAA